MQTLADDSLPASWTCYFRTDDIPACLDTVRAAGGLVLMEPTDIADLGQMALCADPEGADFALWYPYHLQGAGVVDEPGAMCWVELAAHDVAGRRPTARCSAGRPWCATTTAPATPTGRSATGPWRAWSPWRSGGRPTSRRTGPLLLGVRLRRLHRQGRRTGRAGPHPPVDISPGRFSVVTDPMGARLALLTPAVPDRAAVRSRP